MDPTGVLEGRVFPPRGLDEAARVGLVRQLLVWFWYDRRLLDVALARGQLWDLARTHGIDYPERLDRLVAAGP